MTPETIKCVITPEQWEKAILKATQAGIELTGNNGEASSHGFKVSYFYAPEDHVLKITLLDKPMLIPMSMVRSKVAGILAAEGIQTL